MPRQFVDITKNLGALTETQRDDLILKQVGMICYNTTAECLQKYNGTTWDQISGGSDSFAIAWVGGAPAAPTLVYPAVLPEISYTKDGDWVTLHFSHIQLDITGGKTTFIVLPAALVPTGWASGTRYIGQAIAVGDGGDVAGMAWINCNDGNLEILPLSGSWAATSLHIYGFSFTYKID